MTGTLIVGIDPGVKTGIAILDTEMGRLVACRSEPIHEAMEDVAHLSRAGRLKMVVLEDARLRRWLGNKGQEALQGAGSIKRDCRIWVDFLAWLKCPYKTIAPQRGMTKWDSQQFAAMTGWVVGTNEHARDAGCLIWGMR